MAATDEGAARKYKERSIMQYFALYIIGIFATKKHYYLCFALLNFTYSGAKTLIS